jgi:hypothetical protein
MNPPSGQHPTIPSAVLLKDNGVSDKASQPVEAGSGRSSSSMETEKAMPKGQPQPYSALTPSRRRTILALVTVAGFFGPLAGNIYLPALPTLATDFGVGITEINVTVTVFMAVFAVGVSLILLIHGFCLILADPLSPAALLGQLRGLEGTSAAVPRLASRFRSRKHFAGFGAE